MYSLIGQDFIQTRALHTNQKIIIEYLLSNIRLGGDRLPIGALLIV